MGASRTIALRGGFPRGPEPHVAWAVRRRTVTCAAVLALLLSAMLTIDAVALTWGTTRAVTVSRNATADRGLAVTTGNVFHAVFSEARGGVRAVRYRRSANAGASWTSPVVLSSAHADYVYGAAVVARGSYLDAAWVEYRGTSVSLVYRRSTNGGVAWGAPVTIAGIVAATTSSGDAAVVDEGVAVIADDLSAADAATEDQPAQAGATGGRERPQRPRRTAVSGAAAAASPSYPRLVRDAANRVVIAWTDDVTGAMYIRRSTDGGVTWLNPQSIDTTTNKPADDSYFDAFPDVAAGASILYLVYYKSASSLRVRRSTNGGSTWTAATTIASNGSGYIPSVTATGSSAVIGYGIWSSPHLYAAIRRTSDKGATWKTVVKLGSSTGYWTFQPMVARGGSRWQAVYERCLDANCAATGVYYRSSADGVSWTTAVRISSSPRPFESPGGLAYADRVGVAFGDWAPKVLDSDLFFRAGS
jgi:hypothetical protein